MPLKQFSALSLAFLLLLSGCSGSSTESSLPMVVTRIASESALPSALELTGTLVGVQESDLAAKTSGRVLSLPYGVGSRVTSGVEVARLDAQMESAVAGSIGASLRKSEESLRSLISLYDQRIAAAERNIALVRESSTKALAVTQTQISTTKSDLSIDALSILTNVAISTQNIADTLDSIFGVTDKNRYSNDAFESYLGALEPQTKTDAEGATLQFLTESNSFLTLFNTTISGKKPSSAEIDAALTNASFLLVEAKTTLEKAYRTLGKTVSSQQLSDSQITTWKMSFSGLGDTVTKLQNSISTLQGSSDQGQSQVVVLKSQQEKAKTDAVAAVEQAELALATLQREKSAKIAELEGTIASLRGQAGISSVSLSNASVTAPFSGVITKKYTEKGEVVAPGTPLLRIANDSSLKLVTGVSDAVATVLAIGQKATLTVDSLPNQEFSATVSKIDPSADPVSKKISVEFSLPNAEKRLTIGLFARVKLQLPEISGVIVPSSAIVSRYGKTFVYVLKEKKAVRREVTIGTRTENAAVIASGVEDGEEVIVKGQVYLRDGEAVVVQTGGKVESEK